MNFAATISVAAAAIALLAGAMSRRLSLAPGWRDQHGFSFVAFSAAAYAVCNLATALALPDPVVTTTSRFQVASAMLLAWAWLRYARTFHPREQDVLAPWLGRALLALAALALVPGVVFTGAVASHAVPALGVVYRDAVPTPVGELVLTVPFLAAIVALARFLRALRAGVRHSGIHALALVALILFGVNDALATAGVLGTPYLLDTGVVVPIVAVYWTITARFVDNARALHSMRARLEDLVAARTRELADAQAALLRSEKLAALGRFASGVAHEVSSPAAAVTANLRYLQGARGPGAERGDAPEVLQDALASMERINGLVRKLVDAGRVASATPGGTASLADAVRRAAEELRRRPAPVEVSTAVPDDLHVAAGGDTLAEVLSVLLVNASDAAPADRAGRVAVSAERRGARIRLVVADDGVGMTPEVLRRAFDPFFTTKPHGPARGLGLAVARGLVEGNGGALWLEREPGRGTRAVLELPAATAAAVA